MNCELIHWVETLGSRKTGATVCWIGPGSEHWSIHQDCTRLENARGWTMEHHGTPKLPWNCHIHYIITYMISRMIAINYPQKISQHHLLRSKKRHGAPKVCRKSSFDPPKKGLEFHLKRQTWQEKLLLAAVRGRQAGPETCTDEGWQLQGADKRRWELHGVPKWEIGDDLDVHSCMLDVHRFS